MNKRIFTGNYEECKAGNLISISGDRGRKVGYTGKAITKLAPKRAFWDIWYNNVGKIPEEENIKYYIEEYYKQVLSKVDIVLGNDNGNTTSDLFIHTVNKLLTEQGFKVQNNIPYSGGYITKYYGNEIKYCEAIQLELSYQSYIDSRNFNEEEFPNIDTELFKKTQMRMEKFFMNLKSNEVILN